MRVFRVERKKYLETTLQGIGAARSSGFRWNSLYTRLVYTSESRALALLEISVHLDISEDLPTDRVYVEIEIPDSVSVQVLNPDNLPDTWDAKPPTSETQLIGDDFVMQQGAAVLKVPSAIVPASFNYLINPLHPDARSITVVSVIPLKFDFRIKQ
ncbi:RES domain-containing protein [Cyclonatronum proteinivorum]|uniref:RES domain-containing protein n=1 Tax=Cyclonatronum proteinivorum TaxID=1457365 RepID=A0A345UNQ9_9BACT|nr:RES family NAD+ phosphorylase [Cyclonatronum proteinivorum]AXJ02111.1 RES domain-containing protein [Cyclonatronum proteinivorum]